MDVSFIEFGHAEKRIPGKTQNRMANSVNPDEPSNHDLQCLKKAFVLVCTDARFKKPLQQGISEQLLFMVYSLYISESY